MNETLHDRHCPWCFEPAPPGRCPACGERTFDVDDVAPDEAFPFSGRVLDHRYRVTRFLGEGGMGSVYQAYDSMHERMVALKFIRPLSGEGWVFLLSERLRREAKLLARLSSGSIVRFRDYGFYEGAPFLVMEYLRGRSLAWMLERRPCLRPDEVAAVAYQVCRALDAAHRGGVLHRDLKPGNVMLCRDGARALCLKVVDFGIARIVDADTTDHDRAVASGRISGTLGYMPPELFLGEPLSRASDLYSLGIMMYRMAFGALPFEGQPGEVALRHVLHAPSVPGNGALPDGLRALLEGLLQKSPADRPQSARRVMAGLRPHCAPDLDALDWTAVPDPAADPSGGEPFDRRTTLRAGQPDGSRRTEG